MHGGPDSLQDIAILHAADLSPLHAIYSAASGTPILPLLYTIASLVGGHGGHIHPEGAPDVSVGIGDVAAVHEA